MSGRSRRGFTLIELMAAMAVLAVIVLLIGRIMADGTSAYKSGTSRAEINDSGRAIFDFIVQDVASAIAYSNELTGISVVFDVNDTYSIPGAPSGEIYGRVSTELRCVSLNNEPSGSERGVKEIIYRVRQMDRQGVVPDRYQLMRSEMSDLNDVSCYTDPTWWDGDVGNNDSTFAVMAENVAHFSVYSYTTNSAGNLVEALGFNSTDYGGSLPVFVDVYMELLDEKDAILVAATQDDVLARKQARRYQARIYFKNRRGYSG